ncbi:hypothetical protein H5410_005758 [Solanum commersonii]|uniref:Uncharacterized protein n=1 Tax=Solanum commersonii TaxID=4109 RepID=A0A9J6A8E9_SOLCO|nr:hypothetical protein H5410_005758 [Solanum commersonii]
MLAPANSCAFSWYMDVDLAVGLASWIVNVFWSSLLLMMKQLSILQYIDPESLYSLLDSGSISMSLDSVKSCRGTFWTLIEVLSACSTYTICYNIVWLVLEALNIVR